MDGFLTPKIPAAMPLARRLDICGDSERDGLQKIASNQRTAGDQADTDLAKNCGQGSEYR
jgi:hypothetical protein